MLARKEEGMRDRNNFYINGQWSAPSTAAMLDVIKQKATEGLNMPVSLELGMEMWDFSLMEDPGALDWGMYT